MLCLFVPANEDKEDTRGRYGRYHDDRHGDNLRGGRHPVDRRRRAADEDDTILDSQQDISSITSQDQGVYR